MQAITVPFYYYTGYLVPFALVSVRSLGVEATLDLLSDHLSGTTRVDTGVDIVASGAIGSYLEFVEALGLDLEEWRPLAARESLQRGNHSSFTPLALPRRAGRRRLMPSPIVPQRS